MMNLVSEPVAQSVVAQSVDFELCEAFRAPIEHDEPICASCGHLADDHDQMASDAAVTRLPRRAVRRPAPTRKAS